MAFKSFGQNILQMRQQALQKKMHQDRMRQYEEDRSTREMGMGLNLLNSVISGLAGIGTAAYQSSGRADAARAKAEADYNKKLAEMILKTGIKPKEELAAEGNLRQALATQQAKQKAADTLAAQRPQAAEKARREEPLLTRGGMRTGVESESIPRRRLETKPTGPTDFGEKDRYPMDHPIHEFKPGPPEFAPERVVYLPKLTDGAQDKAGGVRKPTVEASDDDRPPIPMTKKEIKRLKELRQEEEQRTVKYDIPEAAREKIEKSIREAQKEVDVARRAVRTASHALQVARQDPLSRAAAVVRAEKRLESQTKALDVALKNVEYVQRFETSKQKAISTAGSRNKIEFEWVKGRRGKGEYKIKTYPADGMVWVPVQQKQGPMAGLWTLERIKMTPADYLKRIEKAGSSRPKSTPPPKGPEGNFERIALRVKDSTQAGGTREFSKEIRGPGSKELRKIKDRLENPGKPLIFKNYGPASRKAKNWVRKLRGMPFETTEQKVAFNKEVKAFNAWLSTQWIDRAGKKEREKSAKAAQSTRSAWANFKRQRMREIKQGLGKTQAGRTKEKIGETTVSIRGGATVDPSAVTKYLQGQVATNPFKNKSPEDYNSIARTKGAIVWRDYNILTSENGPAGKFLKKKLKGDFDRQKNKAKKEWKDAGFKGADFEKFWGTFEKTGTMGLPDVTQLLPSGPGETRLPSQSPRQRMSQDLAFVSASAPEPIAEFHKINSQNWPASKKRRVWEHMARSRGWVAQGERAVG